MKHANPYVTGFVPLEFGHSNVTFPGSGTRLTRSVSHEVPGMHAAAFVREKGSFVSTKCRESLTSNGDWNDGLSHYGCQNPATEQAVLLSNTEAKRFTEAEMVRPADVKAIINH